MKINFNEQDQRKLQELIEVKYLNMSISDMFQEFCSYYGLVDQKKIKTNQDYLKEFLRYFELDENDEETLKVIDEYLKESIIKVDDKLLNENPYFKNIKFDEIRCSNYKLENNMYHSYQLFPYDDVMFSSNYQEKYFMGYFERDVHYPSLSKDNVIWMCIIPNEIKTMDKHVLAAKGKVLTFGLGLGYFAFMTSLKKEVNEIVVVEKSKEVISLFKRHILPQFKYKEKIKIIHEDAYAFLKSNEERFDYIFVDIYHDAHDGLVTFLKFMKYEKKDKFHFWLKNSLIGLFRRLVLTIVEECLENYDDNNYKKAKTNEDKIINKIYFATKNITFNTYDELFNFLSEESLINLIKTLN